MREKSTSWKNVGNERVQMIGNTQGHEKLPRNILEDEVEKKEAKTKIRLFSPDYEKIGM